VFSTLNEAFSKCGDYNKVLPIPGEENAHKIKDLQQSKDLKKSSNKRKRESSSKNTPTKKLSSMEASGSLSASTKDSKDPKIAVSVTTSLTDLAVIEKVSNHNETSGTHCEGRVEQVKALKIPGVSNSPDKNYTTVSNDVVASNEKVSSRGEPSKKLSDSGISSKEGKVDSSAPVNSYTTSPAKCTRSNSRLAEIRCENVISETAVSDKVIYDIIVSKNVVDVEKKVAMESKDSLERPYSDQTNLISKMDMKSSAARHLARRDGSRDSGSKRKEFREEIGTVQSTESNKEYEVHIRSVPLRVVDSQHTLDVSDSGRSSRELEVVVQSSKEYQERKEEKDKKAKQHCEKLSRSKEVRSLGSVQENDRKSGTRSKQIEESKRRSKDKDENKSKSKNYEDRRSKNNDFKRAEERRSDYRDKKRSRDDSRTRSRRKDRDRPEERREVIEKDRKTEGQKDLRRQDSVSDREAYKSRSESERKTGERKEKDLRTKLLSHGSSRQVKRMEEEKLEENSSSKEDKKRQEKQTENMNFDLKKVDSSTKNLKVKMISSTKLDSECEEGEISSSDNEESRQTAQDDLHKLLNPKKTGTETSAGLKIKSPSKTSVESTDTVKNSVSKSIGSYDKKQVESGSNLLTRKTNPQSTKNSVEEPETNAVCPSKREPIKMKKEKSCANKKDERATVESVQSSEKFERASVQNNCLPEKSLKMTEGEVANSETKTLPKKQGKGLVIAANSNSEMNQTEEAFILTGPSDCEAENKKCSGTFTEISENPSKNVSGKELSAEKSATNEEAQERKKSVKPPHSENASLSEIEKQIISVTGNKDSSIYGQKSELEILNPVLLRSDERHFVEHSLGRNDSETTTLEPGRIKLALHQLTEHQTNSESSSARKKISVEATIVSEPVKITKSFQKVGSFSSDDSLGSFASDPKAGELPEDLTNVDTVDLESLIEAKRDLMRQLEEKQNKYLKKMKRSRQNSVFEESEIKEIENTGNDKERKGTMERNIDQPTIVPVLEESGLKIRINLSSTRRVSQTKPEGPNFSFQPIQDTDCKGLQATNNSVQSVEAISSTSASVSPFVSTSSSKKDSPVTHWNITNQKRLTQASNKTDSPRSDKSSPEFQATWKLGSNMTMPPKLNTPQQGQLLNSPATVGDCSPEILTVQWGVSGSQNLFSDSWNATPSPSGQQHKKHVDFASTAG
jgi:hypothetical protein